MFPQVQKEEAGRNQRPTSKNVSTSDSKVKKSNPFNPPFDTEKLTSSSILKKELDEHLKELTSNNDNFPVEALPIKAQDIISQWADCLGYPKDYAAAAAFHTVASAIGNTRRSIWMGAYEVITTLWVILVGNPGVNKSEPIRTANKPLYRLDDKYYDEYETEFGLYDEYKRMIQKGETNERRPEPKLKKTLVEDCTIEALAQVCANNSRGVCMYVDEFMGIIGGMNKYNQGASDQKKFLSMFNGASWNIDRSTRKPIRVKSTCVSIIGTTQPGMLAELAKDGRKDDGFTDRLLAVFPKDLKVPHWSNKNINSSVEHSWDYIINKIHKELNFITNENGEQTFERVDFSKPAVEVLQKWQKSSIKEDAEVNQESILSISAKIYIYVLRFALILHYFKWACGEGRGDDEPISEETAISAIAIANYFKRQGIELSRIIRNKKHYDLLPKIKKDIYDKLGNEFTKAEAGVILNVVNSECIDKSTTLSLRSLETWLNDKYLFEKIKQGHYRKVNP